MSSIKKFRYVYIMRVREMAISGVTSNAEIAERLGVFEKDVRDWRQKIPKFDRECRVAVSEANQVVANFAYRRACEDDTMARWWLDRRHPEFMPKQKLDHTSNGNTLKDLLAEHGAMDEEEARERGLIYDGDDESIPLGAEDECEETETEFNAEAGLDDYDEDGQPIRKKTKKSSRD